MSAIPMRARNSVFAPAAPRPQSIPGLSPGWRPAKLVKSLGGVRVAKMLPRLSRLNPGWLIAAFVAERVYNEAFWHLYLSLNGLQYVQFCTLAGSARFTGSPNSGGSCVTLSGAAPGFPMSALPQQVASLNPGAGIALIGPTGFIPTTTTMRWRTSRTYVVAGSLPGQRQRPFFGLPNPLTVPSPYAAAFPPGRVPYNVRPWPVWSVGNFARGQAIPAPTPGTSEDEDWLHRPAPGWRWDYRSGQAPRSEPINRVDAPARAVPRTDEKEVKIGANTPAGQYFFTLMKAREKVSEVQDFVNVLFDSLPAHVRARYGGAGATDHQKNVAVWENLDRIDGRAFLQNLLANQLEDEIIGRTWIAGRAKMRDQIFGNMIGSTGSLANGAFKEYAKYVSNLSKYIAAGLFGNTNDDRYVVGLKANFERAERALSDLRKAANQDRRNAGGNPAPGT